MTDDTRQAFSYLLRIWRVQDEGMVRWRALLENPSSGERRGFADLRELLAFLEGVSRMNVYRVPTRVAGPGMSFALSSLAVIRPDVEQDAVSSRAPSVLQRQVALWQEQGMIYGLLLRGEALEAAERWVARHPAEITDDESDFLQACQDAQRAERRQFQQARLVYRALIVTALAGLVALCFLTQARARSQLAERARGDAEIAQAQAEDTRRRVESRLLAAHAAQQLEAEPRLAILLGLEAARAGCRADLTIGIEPDVGRMLAHALAGARWESVLRSAHGERVDGAYWSPAGDRVLVSCAGGVAVWSATTGEALWGSSPGEEAIAQAAWSPDGALLLTQGYAGSAILYDAATGQQLASLPGLVTALAWSPDGSRLITGHNDGTVTIWSAALEPLLSLGELPSKAHADESHEIPPEERGAIQYIAWSPDGARALICKPAGVAIWDAHTAERLRDLRGHAGEVRWGEWSPDGATLLTLDSDGRAILWDGRSGAQLRQMGGPADERLMLVAWSPESYWVATAGWNGAVEVWSKATRIRRALLVVAPHGIGALAWSPDGACLAAGDGDGSVKVWRGSELLYTLQGHQDAVSSLSWSPDGKRLLSGSSDGSAVIWNVDPDGGRYVGAPPAPGTPAAAIQIGEGAETLAFGSLEELSLYACARAGRNLTAEEWQRYLGVETPYRQTCAGLP